ncbi:MAG TPA: erythromycin esterase family protein [Actinomycetota bacterium]|nr:erythromycin esterase family protein [Actinomycetota bacterium]
MASRLFRNRREAGRLLASRLEQYRGRDDVLVLALPRGGVPVGYEIANRLKVPLDIFVVRKLGAPVSEELAMGAIASGGVVVPNEDVLKALGLEHADLEAAAQAETAELERREAAYRGDRPPPDLFRKTVILVDDGLATGSSMRAAVRALRKLGPARTVVAVPVAPVQTCRQLEREVDEVVCGETPSPFYAVGQAYTDFTQTSDDEVRGLLQWAWSRQAVGSEAPDDRRTIRSALVPLGGGDAGVYPDVGEAHFVLLGEATHGTHEFYEERARITRWLIQEKGFDAVAVEADWPDAYRVNRYVRGDTEASAEHALRGFQRFPTWMWRNSVVLTFAEWLHDFNRSRPEPARVGFYGLDLYSLYSSMSEVITYLERVDPQAAQRARERYACFDHYGEDGRSYAYAAAFGAGDTCEGEAVEQLLELHRSSLDYVRTEGIPAGEDHFYAEQNARTVKAAEEYYRTMIQGHTTSWNLRDRHMTDTLDELARHLGRTLGRQPRIVVWAHNSHLGDARSTDMGMRGELNVGQLVRERHPGDCFLLGFTTYEGTVTAAKTWGGEAEVMTVRQAMKGSFEELLHEAGEPSFLLDLRRGSRVADLLGSTRLERAIGVVYLPSTERQSHYFRARLSDQFDAVIHFDRTRAVEPLERFAGWERGELPETYPHAV